MLELVAAAVFVKESEGVNTDNWVNSWAGMIEVGLFFFVLVDQDLVLSLCSTNRGDSTWRIPSSVKCSSISSMTEVATSGSVGNSVNAIDVVSRSSGYVAVVIIGSPVNKMSVNQQVWNDGDLSHR